MTIKVCVVLGTLLMSWTEKEAAAIMSETNAGKKRRRSAVEITKQQSSSSSRKKSKKDEGVTDWVKLFLERNPDCLVVMCVNAKLFMQIVCEPLQNVANSVMYHFRKDHMYTNTLASGNAMLAHIELKASMCRLYNCRRNDLPVAFDVVEVYNQLKHFKFTDETLLFVAIPASNDSISFDILYQKTETWAKQTINLLQLENLEEREPSVIRADFTASLSIGQFKRYINIISKSSDADTLKFILNPNTTSSGNPHYRLQLLAKGVTKSTHFDIGDASIEAADSVDTSSAPSYHVSVLMPFISVLTAVTYKSRSHVVLYISKRMVVVEYKDSEESGGVLMRFHIVAKVEED